MSSAGAGVPLGPSIFGFLQAAGCIPPHQWEVGSWLLGFAERHADSAVHIGLFRTGRAGRDWALVSARQARVFLDTSRDWSSDQWQQMLRAVAAKLITRGARPTTLTIHCGDSEAGAARALAVPKALQQAGAGVTTLVVTARTTPRPQIEVLLQRAAAAFPNIFSLQLEATPCTLPPPSAWPGLRDISYTLMPDGLTEAACASLAEHTQHITSLTLTTPAPHELHLPWSTLLPPTTVTHTLTHLTVAEALDHWLLESLLAQAPAVTHLSVQRLCQYLSDHSGRQWGVTQLRIMGKAGGEQQCFGCLLARLPERKGRVVEIRSTEPVYLHETWEVSIRIYVNTTYYR